MATMTKTEFMLSERKHKEYDEVNELSCPYDNYCQGPASRYLFVCSAGMLRSPTAAKVAIGLGYNARSCGSENYALIPLSVNLIMWARTIFFVQEDNYLSALETFKYDSCTLQTLKDKTVVWDLEDIYNYNDASLVALITKNLA